ncbi:hypothetical protein OJ996_13875 [Luteolibacter sp. GHJ8]|uniref:Uncharacterized protein n=1 Tax=Luteolibacter rhizosphaerae TaxID=2989719 RepID=A0ABT3G5A4_9BACT|nr:hypothetical protein [Luteolibacter rhizosphaerae]MCW1914671.1 hypothetical protein [Luteolibacter rhizosphaerae]
MKPELCHEIMACLPMGRTLFHYGKDHYAFHLLRHVAAQGTTVAALRKSAFSPLLEKPAVRAWMAGIGSGQIRAADIPESAWMPGSEAYRLSLGIWGRDPARWKSYQVSRRGVSLVLHLNHNNTQYQRLKRALPKDGSDPFLAYGHPEAGGGFPTIAWARMDIDLGRREALIEEMQTDRIRDMTAAVKRARKAKPGSEIEFYSITLNRDALLDYWEKEMQRHVAIWEEAMLTATLDFLHREIGVRRVFYHTHEGGAALKHIRRKLPPRSLYTTVPRKFCFQLTDEVPGMVESCSSWHSRPSRIRREIKFHLLET